MKKIVKWLKESIYTRPLSPGCKQCATGSKMVLLITGLCPSNCFYCPLSKEKLQRDRIFADEWELKDENDTEKLILEAKYIEADGAGITGGDPLVVWERTRRYIKLLKERFGDDFHIHLYTSGLQDSEHIEDLIAAGLDEIRFHPLLRFWDDMDNSPIRYSIKKTVETNIDTAIEIPAIPGMEKHIFKLVEWADQTGINWVNLNELEFSETNADELLRRGFDVKDDISSAVKGSQETAVKIVEFAKDLRIGVHYCSSSFKDGIQLRNRIMRRAKNTAKEYEIITEEGTILKGIIVSSVSTLNEIKKTLVENFGIDEKKVCLDSNKKRVEIPLFILEKIANNLNKLGYKCYMVEEYPTADRLEVEKIPLPF